MKEPLMRSLTAAALLALALPLPAAAQPAAVESLSGTRLDIVATGEVTRVPDIVRINAGVTTQGQTASEAIQANAARIEAMRAALRRAGVADRDIQTSSVNLNAEYRHVADRPPVFTGYRASHMVGVRFRDAANAGRILDALVAAGANELNGPTFEVERPAAALDEARTRALADARARAQLYAGALGMRVKRILAIGENGGIRPMPMGYARAEMAQDASATNIVLGEQVLAMTLTVSFELE
jgi:uncharacterized protein YggE